MIELSEDYVLGLQTKNRRLKAEVRLVDDHLEKLRSRLVKALGRGDDLATPVDAVLAVCARLSELEAGTMGQLLLRALRERDEAKACMAELKDKLREPWRRVNVFPGDQPAPESLSCMYVHCWFEEAESWAAKRIAALEDGDRWVDPRLPDQRGEGKSDG